MNCVKCSGETRVVNSRPHKDDATVIQRRRWCDACGHKFNTYESLTDDVARRARVSAKRTAEKARQRARFSEDDLAKRRERNRLYMEAYRHAQDTGRDVTEIRKEWGIAA